MTQQRSLKRRHLLGFRVTYEAPSDNRLLEDAGNDNLFRLNDDFGVPSTHARLPFKALPNGLIVVKSSELVSSPRRVRQRSKP
jgi:hypothetical protein